MVELHRRVLRRAWRAHRWLLRTAWKFHLQLYISENDLKTKKQTSSLKTSSSSSSCLNLLARFASLALLPLWKSSFRGLKALAGEVDAFVEGEEGIMTGDAFLLDNLFNCLAGLDYSQPDSYLRHCKSDFHPVDYLMSRLQLT